MSRRKIEENKYTINRQVISLEEDITLEDIRLIINETQQIVICSSMQKYAIDDIPNPVIVYGNSIEVNDKICVLQPTDKLTIEIDKGEEGAKEQTLTDGVNMLAGKIDNIKLPEIDTTELAQESTLQKVSAKLDNLNVDVDLSLVAKQGENQEATNTAILEGINEIFDKFDGMYAEQLAEIIGE